MDAGDKTVTLGPGNEHEEQRPYIKDVGAKIWKYQFYYQITGMDLLQSSCYVRKTNLLICLKHCLGGFVVGG